MKNWQFNLLLVLLCIMIGVQVTIMMWIPMLHDKLYEIGLRLL